MKSKIIAVQEELLQKSEWEFFLKPSAVRVVVLSRRQLTFEMANEIHNKFQYSNFFAVHGVPSGIYPNKYDLYLFAPQNYTEAQQFAIKNPHIKIIVISTPELELKFEDTGNFSVKTWQYISTYINDIRGIKPKELKVPKVKSAPTEAPVDTANRPDPVVEIRRWSEPEPDNEGSIVDELPPDESDQPERTY